MRAKVGIEKLCANINPANAAPKIGMAWFAPAFQHQVIYHPHLPPPIG
jgi:hypothetical protein